MLPCAFGEGIDLKISDQILNPCYETCTVVMGRIEKTEKIVR